MRKLTKKKSEKHGVREFFQMKLWLSSLQFCIL